MSADSSGNDPVLVVGAGPVGMVLAAFLLRQDVPVRIVDREPRSTLHSRAVILWPRSLELLRPLGAADELTGIGEHIERVSYYSGSRRLGDIDMTRLRETPYPFGLCTPQHRTEDVLRACVESAGAAVESEVELVDLDGSGERPEATLRHADGTRERVRARWVIGADGAHSAVRRLLDIPFEGTGADVLFAICDAPLDAELPRNEMLYCYDRGGAMGLAPFRGTDFRVACSVPVWNDDEPPPHELFQRNLDAVVPFPARLGELKWTTVFRARRRTAGRFRAGRCFLVGDAAHIFSAAGSQGMNTGIQDAVNLAWKLAAVEHGTMRPEVLDGYDPERRHSAKRVSRLTAKQTSWGLISRRDKVVVRDALVGAARKSGVLQHVVTPMMSQLSVRYRPDAPERASDLRLRKLVREPGGRIPVFTTGSAPGPWPEVAGDRLTVLLWSGETRDAAWRARCAAIRAEVPAGTPVQDVSSWAVLREFLGRDRCAVVVRPDGHVAAIERGAVDPGAVRSALRRSGALDAAGAPAEGAVR